MTLDGHVCRRPSAPDLAGRGFRSHDLSLARMSLLLPYCSPLLGITAAHGSRHGGTIMLAQRRLADVQSSVVSADYQRCQRTLLLPLRGFALFRQPDLHRPLQASACALLPELWRMCPLESFGDALDDGVDAHELALHRIDDDG